MEHRGAGRYAVFQRGHRYLGITGTWSWGHTWPGGEPTTDAEWEDYNRSHDAWLDAHRFDLDTALRLAREAAPLLTVNGHTVTHALRLHAERNQR